MENHNCIFDYSILPKELPPHRMCTKDEEDGIIIYTLYWSNHRTCVIQKDGPVTIMDYRTKPFECKLYDNLTEAIGPLLDKLI